ncbi:hypothetical protein [Streptomyces sp. MNP-20]|uniref:hypothetical protein n=1 Tax=Streptomyces sp. MNP-20 TaxID=2721165 RepID=UPI001555EED9|nr:hypothetical protein [Streptomyces sp. MNP-20]
MRLTLAVTALAALSLMGCSGDNSSSSHASPKTTSTTPRGEGAKAAAPLSSAALNKRLLTVNDLGEGYVRKAPVIQHNDDVRVIGCPALDKLGSEGATGVSLSFPRRAKTAFAYSGSSNSEMSEDLYSGAAGVLSDGVGKIFDAMVSCPTYQVVAGTTVIDMTTQTTTAPALGEEQWSQLLTYAGGGQRTIVKQTAIRAGNVVVIVSGSPTLVDAHLDKALAKAQTR